jgi:hypothetical protein
VRIDYALRVRRVIHADGDDLSAERLYLAINPLQLDQLRLADPSKEAAIEDDGERFRPAQARQRHIAAGR